WLVVADVQAGRVLATGPRMPAGRRPSDWKERPRATRYVCPKRGAVGEPERGGSCGRSAPRRVGGAPRQPMRSLAPSEARMGVWGDSLQGGKSARSGSTGLVSSQKQVERQGRKVRKDAASRG